MATIEITPAAVEADLLLTPFVVVGQLRAPGHCQAWMDSTDRVCSTATDGHLCPRHRTVARKRRARRLAEIEAEQSKDRAAKAAAAERARGRLGGNRRELAAVEAELAHLSAVPVDDRAAAGGAVHPSI
ncbi:hypothetical protein D6T26_25440, partial [Salmonella enterica subsp. enterica serovar Typhi]|nr:hypothetical protein [Salmonella enterica subsp. enterica serovar Typhi]